MARSQTLMDTMEEELKRGVQRIRDEPRRLRTSAGHTRLYDTFDCTEGEASPRFDLTQQEEMDERESTKCSPIAALRCLTGIMGRKKQERWPLTERRRPSSPPSSSSSATCSSPFTQITRFVPSFVFYVVGGVVHVVKGAAAWMVEGLKDYAASGGYYMVNDITPSYGAVF